MNSATRNQPSSSGIQVSPAGPFTFTEANWSTPVTVTVTATNDSIHEGSHVGTITPSVVTTAYGYADLTPTAVTATITDNDTAGIAIVLSASTTMMVEGGSDSYTIVLESEPTAPVTVTLTRSDTGQFNVSTSSIVFTATNWSVPVTITVTAINDVVDEPDTTYDIQSEVRSTDPFYDNMTVSGLPVEIIDNDLAGITVTGADDLALAQPAQAIGGVPGGVREKLVHDRPRPDRGLDLLKMHLIQSSYIKRKTHRVMTKRIITRTSFTLREKKTACSNDSAHWA